MTTIHYQGDVGSLVENIMGKRVQIPDQTVIH